MTAGFDRVPTLYRPLLERALHLLDQHVALPFVLPRILCGVSPHFVGLHYFYELAPDYRADGDPDRPFEEFMHCTHPESLTHRPPDDRQTTIVMPNRYWVDNRILGPGAFLHELGHVVDHLFGHSVTVPETSRYSRTNRAEAFAEGFEILICTAARVDGYEDWGERVRGVDFDPLRAAVGWRSGLSG